MIDRFKLVTSNKESLFNQLNIMLSQNEAVEVVAKPWKEKRSLSQNRLLWQWMNEISEQAIVNDQKHEPEIWHEYFKRYLCPSKIIPMPAGDGLEVKSTKKLDTGEMHHYLNKIEEWAQGHFYTLTIPHNCEYEQLKQKQDM